jgi:signal transduction histidine kinase
MRHLFFYLLLALCSLPALSAPLSLVTEKAFFKDTAGSMRIDGIAAGKFSPFKGNFQMIFETSPLWIRLTLEASPAGSADAQNLQGLQVVRVGPHSLDHIELYENVAGKWVQKLAGDTHPNTRKVCPDDHHCFELSPGRNLTDLASVDANVLQGQALMNAVAARITNLTLSITIALGLLFVSFLMMWKSQTSLFLVYCIFQFSVVVFLATNTGWTERMLPTLPPENLNLLSQASLIARYFFMTLGGWVILAHHQPTRLYKAAILTLWLMSAVSISLLFMGHTQSALLVNMLIFYLVSPVQIYGIISSRAFEKGWRYIILLSAYGIGTLFLTIGTLALLGILTGPIVHSAANTGGDWRLNGLFAGVLFFLLVLSEEKSRWKEKQQEIEVLRKKSEQAHVNEEKFQERSALIDMLTHELKTPLGTIQFSLATLRRAVAGDGESLQRISRIDASVKRMDDLIEHVADSNKIERSGVMAQPELIPAHELIQELLDDYPLQERFRLSIAPNAAFLADRKMLCLVLENLISNAIKYSVDRTAITLDVTTQAGTGVPDSPDASDALDGRGWTCFEISNEVAPEQAPDESRLFERYYRHPGVQGLPGMGIGLSLVDSAAQKIGALVSFRKDGQQVFFTVRIPN